MESITDITFSFFEMQGDKKTSSTEVTEERLCQLTEACKLFLEALEMMVNCKNFKQEKILQVMTKLKETSVTNRLCEFSAGHAGNGEDQSLQNEQHERLDNETSVKEQSKQLDVAALRRQKDCLERVHDSLKLKQQEKESFRECCFKLEQEKNSITEDIQILQYEIMKQQQTLEQDRSVERSEQLEKEVGVLRQQRGYLQEECKSLKAKLTEKDVFKERCVQLEAERHCALEEKKDLLQKISWTTQQIARELSWKEKLKVMEMSKSAIKTENEQLKKLLEKLTKKYDSEKLKAFKYKQKVIQIEGLRGMNDNLQEQVGMIQSKMENQRAMLDNYAHIILQGVEVRELKNLKQNMDDLREDNSKSRLNQEILSKNMLKVTLQTAKVEQKSLFKRSRCLKKQVLKLQKIKKEQRPLLDEVEAMNCENEYMRQQNEQLQKEFEVVFVKAHSREVVNISHTTMKKQKQEIDRLNQELKEENQKLRIRTFGHKQPTNEYLQTSVERQFNSISGSH